MPSFPEIILVSRSLGRQHPFYINYVSDLASSYRDFAKAYIFFSKGEHDAAKTALYSAFRSLPDQTTMDLALSVAPTRTRFRSTFLGGSPDKLRKELEQFKLQLERAIRK